MNNQNLWQVMSGRELNLALSRIAAQIIEDHPDLDEAVLIGIRTRGVPLAEMLRKKIEALAGKQLPLGILDPTFYRDDLSMVDTQPVAEGSHLNFDVAGKDVIIGWTLNCANDVLRETVAIPSPEPGTMALLGLGLVGLVWGRKRFFSK